MSEENVEVARGVGSRLVVPSGTRGRTLDERILVRFPSLARVLAAAWAWLPPRSRLRRALLSRWVRQTDAATNRRDFGLLFLTLAPDIEFRFAGDFVPPDLVGVHRGHDAYRRAVEAGVEEMDLKFEHEEVIDFGDRLLAAGRYKGRGRSSGIPVNNPFFSVFTLRRGLVIRQEDFTDRDKALEAAGLSE